MDGGPNWAAEKPNYDRDMIATEGVFGSRGEGDIRTQSLWEAPLVVRRVDDSILEISTIRLALMEAEIRSKREQITVKMRGIEDALGQLDNLDESAKVRARCLFFSKRH